MKVQCIVKNVTMFREKIYIRFDNSNNALCNYSMYLYKWRKTRNENMKTFDVCG